MRIGSIKKLIVILALTMTTGFNVLAKNKDKNKAECETKSTAKIEDFAKKVLEVTSKEQLVKKIENYKTEFGVGLVEYDGASLQWNQVVETYSELKYIQATSSSKCTSKMLMGIFNYKPCQVKNSKLNTIKHADVNVEEKQKEIKKLLEEADEIVQSNAYVYVIYNKKKGNAVIDLGLPIQANPAAILKAKTTTYFHTVSQ